MYEVLAVVPGKWVSNFLDICKKQCSIKEIIQYIHELQQQAYPTHQIFAQLNELIIESETIDNPLKAEIGEYLAEASFRSSCSKADFIHLLDFAVNTQEILTVPVEHRRWKAQGIANTTSVRSLR